MGLDQLNEGAEIGVDHPGEQGEQRQQIDPDRDQDSIAGEQQKRRDRCAGNQHHQTRRRRETAKTVGDPDATHEEEQSNRRAQAGLDRHEQRQDPGHKASAEHHRGEANSCEFSVRLCGGQVGVPQPEPLGHPNQAGCQENGRQGKSQPDGHGVRKDQPHTDTVDQEHGIKHRHLLAEHAELLDKHGTAERSGRVAYSERCT
ncbi:hypothetical protein [Bradyrhizobium sp. CCBAU 45384]|uniref:hypothetical protein n=1 Tax=Bradyrhizobium sp. CCBAU 45384 TaxID=858428 RepID=UPI002306DC8A|nr:hypothetical protein [Bradyrhizobium sp. CCBAU 45384]